MYELKQRAIHEGVYPKHFPIPVLAQEFCEMVYNHGRITENCAGHLDVSEDQLVSRDGHVAAGTGPVAARPFLPGHEGIKRKEELARMMEAVDNIDIDKLTDVKPKRKPAH